MKQRTCSRSWMRRRREEGRRRRSRQQRLPQTGIGRAQWLHNRAQRSGRQLPPQRRLPQRQCTLVRNLLAHRPRLGDPAGYWASRRARFRGCEALCSHITTIRDLTAPLQRCRARFPLHRCATGQQEHRRRRQDRHHRHRQFPATIPAPPLTRHLASPPPRPPRTQPRRRRHREVCHFARLHAISNDLLQAKPRRRRRPVMHRRRSVFRFSMQRASQWTWPKCARRIFRRIREPICGGCLVDWV